MNLAKNIELSQRLFPDKPALIFEGQSVTYRELNEMSNRVANGLSELGISRGDRVALLLPNIPAFVAAYLGIQKIGAVPVAINSALKAEEVKYIIEDSGALILITTEVLRANRPAQEISQLKYILIAEGEAKTDRALSELMANASPTALAIEMAPDDPAALLYTSGTTGFPKGAILSHGNLVSNIRMFVDTVGTHPDDRILLFLPASHSYGQTATLFPCLEAGATLVLHRELEIDGIIKSIVDNGVTTFFGVSTIYTLLYEKASAEQLRTIQRYVSGGAPLPLELAKKWRDKFGVSINEKYGSTETSLICFNQTYKPGSVGLPLEGVEVKLIDSKTGQEVPPGELGEVVVRGPNVMLGYWNRPTETALVLKQGWFHTGDIGRTDEAGYFYLVDRIKDMINVGGLKVYPSEVENLLYQHPAVAEVAVYGVPEPLLGEQVIASIIPKSGVTVTTEEIVAFCRQNLADFKVPNLVELVDSLPKGRTGKILKKVLREEWRPRSSKSDESSVQNVDHLSPESLKKWISDWLETELALDPETIETDRTFVNYGLNSTLAVMLVQDLNDWLGQAMESDLEISLSTTLAFHYPTIDQLTTFLLETVDESIIVKQTELPSSPSARLERDNDQCESKEGLQLPKGHTHDEVYPLSYGQRALWFLYQLAPESAAYNTALTLRIRSALDIQALQNTFQVLTNRHPCLRTTFATIDGEPLQKVHQDQAVCFEQIDASVWSWDELKSRVVETYQKPFNLEQGPVLRVSLFTRSKEDQILLLTIHHIVFDGWSQWMLIEELGQLYPVIKTGRQASLPILKHSYADYVHWQREMVASAEGERLFAYWEKQLAGELPVLNLPTDHPRPPTQTYNGASVHFGLAETLSQRLKELAQTEDASLYTVILAIFQILLYRYTGQEELCVGSPTAGRTRGEFAKIAGYFINMVVLRAVIKGDFTFKAFLGQIRQTVLSALDHQDYPFPLLVERLQSYRDSSRSPLFQVCFVLQNPQQSGDIVELFASDKTGMRVNWGGIELEPFEMDQQEGQFDLTLEMMETKGSLVGSFSYNTDLFELATITRMVGHFQTLLEGIVANPLQPIHTLPLLTQVEQQQLKIWNDTATDYPVDKTIVDLFEEQVEKTPLNIAVVFEQQQLTYRQLNQKANQLAHHLLTLKNQLGIKPTDSLIAIAVERSMEMVIGLLGILKAGSAYVPIDPSYPAARIGYMLKDSAAPLLLTQSHRFAPLSELEHECVVVCLEEVNFANQPTENPLVGRLAEDLAYVIYTSGSTGKPKGTMNTHRGIVNRLLWMQETYRLTYQDRILQKTPFSFDVSVWEFFWPLQTGASLVVAKPEGHKEPAYLASVIATYNVTVLHFVPSMLQAFISHAAVNNCHSLKRVICSGEALSFELVQQFFAHFTDLNIELHNLYGPTEAAVDVSHWPCQIESTSNLIPIGKPVANTQLYILDANHQVMPIGVLGELCIVGIQVGRGYLNRPELTKEKFVEVELFGKTERIYKTGDLARWLPDGNLEYLGRIDNQIKLRGFRIELGEIEAVLKRHEAVKEAVVTLYEADDNTCAEPSRSKRLVAYFTTDSESNELVAELKNRLKTSLPDYMVPSHFTVLDKLPLTPNGKIDRKALPAPDSTFNQNAATFIKPQTTLEQQIAEVWQEVLKLKKVGIQDNFFDLGGHSLLLIQVQSRLQALLTESLPVVKLFQYPTIQSLAAYLTRNEPEKTIKPIKPTHDNSKDIAIIGMAGRFPGAQNIEIFWNNLREGLESIQFFSDEELLKNGVDPALLNHPDYVKAGGVLDNAELFDATFFGYTPIDAEILDPQQRLFLEIAWTAIEHAGYFVPNIHFPVGVFAGVGMNTYLINNLIPNQTRLETLGHYQIMLGSDKDFMATRTAYQLNLKGPALTIQTACSTSLVAVHVAAQSLLNGECEMALAGGVSISFPQIQGYLYQQDMIVSPDGHCRAFDAGAQGTVGGAGVGVVILKRLSQALIDGDTIHAVIKGSAINNDGMDKVGFTAPSVDGQAAVITEAMRGLDYESISYIEAHGTGTILGDPIEITALTQAYRPHTQKTGYCALGSVKTNVGHLDTAAGVTGLIKTVLALKHREIPPSLHFKNPNPQIDFVNSPFFVNTELRSWQSPTPLRAGVSSFGIGGTNAHLVVEEAPMQTSSQSSRWQIVCLSAKTETALKQACHHLADYLATHPALNLADVAYTLNLGRKAFSYRGFLLSQNLPETAEILHHQNPSHWRQSQTNDRVPQVVFMFPGQGAQYVNMAVGLYQNERVFRDTVDECTQLLKQHLGLDLCELLYASNETRVDIQPTQWAQPALFVTEYALAKLCIAWGIEPVAMIGHSIGEYVAACLAGVFSLSDALQLVAVRGQLMHALPKGEMLSISLSKNEVERLLTSELSIAAHNAPNLCTVSGATTAIDTLIQTLESQQIEYRRLQTSHAFHSPMMESMLPAFREQLQKLSLNPPQWPYISNLTGALITPTQATSVDYWCNHLLNTVAFSEGIQTLLEQSSDLIFLELGPGRALSSLARQHQSQSTVMAFNLLRPATSAQDDSTFLFNTLGQLWLNNVKLDWAAFYANEQRLRIPLPTYPFERQRYWIDPIPVAPAIPDQNVKRPLDDWFYLPHWKRISLALQPDTKALNLSNWLIFHDKQGLGVELAQALEKQGSRTIEVRTGQNFEQHNAQCYTINPHQREDYQSLFDALMKTEQLPQAILHLWSLDTLTELEQSQWVGFYSLMFLAQIWPQMDQDRYLFVVSNQIHAVTWAEELQPLAATLLGPVQTIGSEYPDIHCRHLDIVRPSSESDIRQQVVHLLAECQTTSPERLVAYRNRQRWIRTFESIRFPAVNSNTATLRHQGVYLITGGLGGIGLSLATYLAETVQAKLILIGRSVLPESQTWDDWLSSHTKDDVTARKIHRLRELQSLGAEILVLQADVSNREQMQTVIFQSQAQFGQIHGIIHAADVPADGVIELKTTSEAARILSPKVQGSLILTELLDAQQLDFLVLCSSLNAIMETPGQVDYCGANAFLDAYTQALYTQGINAISINWDGWQEVGMAANMMLPETLKAAYVEDLQTNGIRPAEGVEAFARILARPMPQVLLSTISFQARLQKQKTEWFEKSGPLKNINEISRHQRPTLTTEYVAPRSLTEQQIADIWQLLLGIEPIGIYDDFFELGGHSLLGTQVVSRLREKFSLDISLEVLFEHSVLEKLAKWLDKQQRHDTQLPPITSLAEGEPLVLSFAQQRLWFLAQLEGSSATYNIPAVLQLSGDLNLEALQQSLHWLIQRHTSLRTCFPTDAGQATVLVQEINKIKIFTIHDLTGLSPETQAEKVQKQANHHAITPFDLANGPLFKVDLLKLNDKQSVLLLNMHHIISDGWSMGIFIRDWQQAYTAFAQDLQPSLPPLALQYSDYAAWQRDWLSGEVEQQQLAYWREQLTGSPELLELPTDKPRLPQQSYQGAHYTHSLSTAVSQSITELSQQQRVTVFMTLLAGFNILLSRYSRQDDICVGSPIANRTHRQTEDLIGFFVNTLVLRSQLKPQQSFLELLQATRTTCLEAYAHQDIPFEMLVEQLQPTRSLSHSPLFQVMLVLQNNAATTLTLPGLEITPLAADYPIAQFDLTLSVEEREGQLHCVWEYATDLFEAKTIELLSNHFEVLLTAIVDNPKQFVSQLPILTASEIQQLQAWNDTATDYPSAQTIVDLFEQQVLITPDNIAVVFEQQQLTYLELNEKANQLGQKLRDEGIRQGKYVPVLMNQSLEVPIAFLAIMKSGAAFVPIDIHWPETRIEKILTQLNSQVILVNHHFSLLSRLSSQYPVFVKTSKLKGLSSNWDDGPNAEDPIYVIYTSGTTGEPKGAINQHRGIINRFLYMNQTYGCLENDVVLQTTPHHFDSVVWQLFWPLINGAKTVIPPENFRFEPKTILELIVREKVTVTDFVPTVFSNIVEELSNNNQSYSTSCLRQLLIGGEAINPKTVSQFQSYLPHVNITNAYGPSETSIGVVFYEITNPAPPLIPIGKPIANVNALILDNFFNLLPIGVPGELYIGGVCVGLGYFNNEAETKAHFINNPFPTLGCDRLYKTGDLAKWRPDGNIEYLGRIDHQVKLRGFRIELSEIEAVLNQHPVVKEAVATLYEADDNKRLVAYLTTNSEPNELVAELKDLLTASLPNYMVPSHFTVLEHLPLTPNGKIDRKALPPPDSNTLTLNTLPRDAIELQLLGVWETVLDVHPLSIDDNFFELGGHSLLAVKLMSHTQQQFGVRLPVSALFQSPTVATLAQQLRQDTTPLFSHLVPIQTKGKANPVYGLPGAVGSVMYLYPLASYLGQQQPFYALQTPGLDGSTTPDTVEALARFHLQALQQHQPDGPYQLMGHSTGAGVAFEMAWQLEQQGETVAFLAILDTSAPNDSNQPNPMADYTEVNWLSDIILIFEEVAVDLNLPLEQLQAMPDLEAAYLKVMQAFIERQILFAPGAAVDELKALVNTYRITVQGDSDYQIPGKLHCPIHLFRASEKTPNAQGIEFEETREARGWAECTHAKVEELMVPGTHVTMMALPHVKTLADKLSQYLQPRKLKLD